MVAIRGGGYAVGAVVGLGLLDKWTTGFLLVGLAVGLLLVPERTVLQTPWLLAGAGLALLIWSPNVLWQARHGWPQLEVARGLRNPTEALFTAPGALVLCWRRGHPRGSRTVVAHSLGRCRAYRSLAIAFGVIVVLVTVTQGKPYYAGVFTPVLFAAGAAAGVTVSNTWISVMTLWGIVSIPLAMPLLPASTADGVRHVNKEVGEMVGWPQLVDTVDGVYADHRERDDSDQQLCGSRRDRAARRARRGCRNRSADT